MEFICNSQGSARRPALNHLPHGASSSAFPDGQVALKRLFFVLGSILAVSIGPVAVSTAAGAGLVAMQIFLGLCRLGPAVFQTFSL
jgi:hypothetical protein